MYGNLRLIASQEPPRRPGRLTRAAAILDAWGQRRRQRRNLLELSDHVLKDIGISRSEAYFEGRKPFWRR